MKIFIGILAALAGLFLLSLAYGTYGDFPREGDRVKLQVSYPVPACPSAEATARMRKLIKGGETQAAAQVGYRSGCRMIEGQTIYILESLEDFGEHWCVRERNQVDCLWVPKALLKRVPA